MFRVKKSAKCDGKMRLVQITLNHCRVCKNCCDYQVQAVIKSESHRKPDNNVWITDLIFGAALWSSGGQGIQQTAYSWLYANKMYIYNYYVPTSLTLTEYEDILVFDAKGRRPKVIADHFNTWATEWKVY